MLKPPQTITWIPAKAGVLVCAAILILLARPVHAAELAVLSNGFTIRHEHRLVMGATTRLYLSADDSSFMDVATSDITGFETDFTQFEHSDPPAAVSSPSPSVPANPASPKSATVTSWPTKPGSGKHQKAKPGPSPALDDVIASASATYHLDPDLVNSVIHAESGFNAHAVSPKGARGLMQLMPGTASQLGVNDAFDPQDNVTGGSRYLRELLERYDYDLVKALAAYNAGPQRVEQYGGLPPYRETHAYVARIVHEYNQKKIAQEKAAKKQQAAAKIASKATSKTTPSDRIAAKTPAKPVTTEAAR
jgi:hypothetical protein